MKLNALVDESDPDVNIPNLVHAFQTAERIHADHPQDDWFHLTGLIHDLGKVRQSLDLAVLEDRILEWSFFPVDIRLCICREQTWSTLL